MVSFPHSDLWLKGSLNPIANSSKKSNSIDTHQPSYSFEYLSAVHLASEQQGPNDGLESDDGNDVGHFTIFAIVDRKCFSDSDARRVNISFRFSGFYVISCRSVRCRRSAVCVCVCV